MKYLSSRKPYATRPSTLILLLIPSTFLVDRWLSYHASIPERWAGIVFTAFTISGYLERFGKYLLSFPNKEVERGFLNFLVPAYMPARDTTDFDVSYFIEEVERGDAEGFMTRLQAFYADVDYKIIGDMEIYFQNSLYLFFKVLGFHTCVEYHFSSGSADVVIKTPEYIYIIECKKDSSAEAALAQIEEKNYAAPFAADPRHLFKIGINFSTSARRIDGYLIRG